MWRLTSPEGEEVPIFFEPITKIGRKQGVTLKISDKYQSVSRYHCTFELVGDFSPSDLKSYPSVLLKDSSKFGTFVNGNKCRNTSINLSKDTKIRFGHPRNGIYKIERKPFKLCFSRVPRNVRKSLTRIAKTIGAHVPREWSDSCTHLIAPELEITEKVLFALVNGVPIVTQSWLEDMLKEQRIPNVDSYKPEKGRAMLEAKAYSQIHSQSQDHEIIDRRSLFVDRAFIWANCSEEEFKKDRIAELFRHTGAAVHFLDGEEPLSFWKNLGPFAIIDSRATEINACIGKEELSGKIPAQALKVVNRIFSKMVICSAISFGCSPMNTFCEIDEVAPTSLKRPKKNRTLGEANDYKKKTPLSPGEQNEWTELEENISADDNIISPESSRKHEGEKKRSKLLEWSKNEEYDDQFDTPGQRRKRNDRSEALHVMDANVTGNSRNKLNGRRSRAQGKRKRAARRSKQSTESSSSEKKQEIVKAKMQPLVSSKKMKATIVRKSKQSTSYEQKIPSVEEIEIDYNSQQFRWKRRISPVQKIKLEGSDEVKSEMLEQVDPSRYNNVIGEPLMVRKEGFVDNSSFRTKSHGGLKNFKKFRTNPKAKLARQRAVKRHVEFDVAIHDKFLTREWLTEANKDDEEGKDIDKLLRSNKIPRKPPPQRRKIAQGSRSTKPKGRVRRARRR